MEIPTTREELELLLKSLHNDCETATGGNCDLFPLLELVRDSGIVAEVCNKWMMGGLLHIQHSLIIALCSGIKIGYQIKNPELVSVKEVKDEDLEGYSFNN